MDKSNRMQALSAYRARADHSEWDSVMDYAELVLDCRDRISETARGPVIDKATFESALKNNRTVLAESRICLDGRAFADGCRKLVGLFASCDLICRRDEEMLSALPWESIAKAAEKAAQNPEAFFSEACRILLGGKPEAAAEALVRGILGEVLRAYLGEAGKTVTQLLEADAEKHTDRLMRSCPTCGSAPALSAVLQGNEDVGNQRRLYCACCGTVWPYERLRCALCGNANPGQLKYVHEETDLAHRLHVCSACGGAIPSIFREALGEPFDQDLEAYACAPLAEAWMAQNEPSGQ